MLSIAMILFNNDDDDNDDDSLLSTVSDRCALYCVAMGADGERMYRKFSDDVIDGTLCNRAPNSVCINGTCQVRSATSHVVSR